MSVSGIQGQLLEVTVVGGIKLKDTEWFSQQDPYVWLEYGSTKFRTRTCTDGGRNPTFQEKFVFTLIEGLRELNVVVWNSNTLNNDDFIGSGKVQLQKVLTQGFDDSPWTLQTKSGRYAGEIRLILHYAAANKPAAAHSPSAPPYMGNMAPPHHYPAQPPVSAAAYPSAVTAHSAPPSYPPSYPPSTVAYPPPSASAYPPAAYPPSQPTAYPPQPYPPHSVYPPPVYPPPLHDSSHYPPGPYPGIYPPPPPHY